MSVEFAALRKELVFTHRDDATGVISVIAIQRLCEDWRYKLVETVLIDVEPHMADFFLKNRGIEGHRLARVTRWENPDPITLLKWPDGTDLLADGNHRYVAAAIKREARIAAKLVPRSVWNRFQVTHLPEKLSTEAAFNRVRSNWSGIP